MKTKRHLKIFELIKENAISTQEELQSLLKRNGFDVTQATVSRDIKELRLGKSLDATGNYFYRVVGSEQTFSNNEKFINIFKQSVVSLAVCGNLLVVKCMVGMGNAACAALDSMGFEEVVGSIAGDDTIFVAVKDQSIAEKLLDKLNNEMLGK